MMVAVALAAVALTAAVASAHNVVFRGSVLIDLARPFKAGEAEYFGQAFSPKKRCRRGRLVELFHDSNPDFKIGQDRTNREGDWRIVGPAPPSGDEVYATMDPRFLPSDFDHSHRCRRDRSRNYDINDLLNP
jgi:hypothetical protein